MENKQIIPHQKHPSEAPAQEKPNMAVADRFTWQPGEVEILGDYHGKAEPAADAK